MRFGIWLPTCRHLATPEIIRTAAVRAEALGYDSVWVSDHVVVPRANVANFGTTIFDPLVTLGVVAGATRRVRLGTTVLIVPYRHAVVAAKNQAALRHGLTPILCVGEGLDVRKSGAHVQHCTDQLDAALAGLTAEQVGTIVIAYEPVWAIGTGEVATPEDAQEVCGALRSRLAERFGPETAAVVRILYGGSVKAANTAGILAGPDVDGALVGGASLDADEFAQICRIAAGGS